ncbi:tRNA (guanine-N(1)-)-methyltransferase [Planctomycetales bacterium]|nr:tRNA (guanine-N(1)-)-methyltransferase [Planctomycetales bacterium]
MIQIDVLTLFPGIFDGFLSESIVRDAIGNGKISVRLFNMRDWANDKHSTMDDRPFGGGPGMVLKVDRVVPCVEDVLNNISDVHHSENTEKGRLLMLTPQGEVFQQRMAEGLAKEKRIVIMCGRYEGFDERIVDILKPEEISIGDYVLNGGEVAAMVVIEAVMRLIPGVLGDEDSSRFDSFSSCNRLLDCAQYTRPREYRGLEVPQVLLGGNHGEIAAWRNENSLQRTREKRPDLITQDTDTK